MAKSILVPFDGSQNALEALNLAISIAKAFNDKIILLNVQPNLQTVHTKMFFNNDTIREYQEILAQEALAPAKSILEKANIDYQSLLRIGDPKERICLEAKDARLIVMGSRGMNPVVGSVLGSVSYGVLQQASCPVTIVPNSRK